MHLSFLSSTDLLTLLPLLVWVHICVLHPGFPSTHHKSVHFFLYMIEKYGCRVYCAPAGMSAPLMRSKKSFAQSSKATSRMGYREQREVVTMSSPETCWPVPMRAIGAQNLLTMPGGVSAAGYLHKKGGSQFSLMKWPLRYIIIHKGCVYYFKSSTSPAPQGAFSLNGYNRVMRAAEETTSSNVFPFKIVHFSKKHRTWFFSAASEDERRKWMRHLRREIDHYNDRNESHISSDSDTDADSFYGTIERPMEIKHPVESADDDYVDDDQDEDEEDYLKPDNDVSPSPSGRPLGPPPSYPPPPVPAALSPLQDLSPSLQNALPPAVLPQHRIPTAPLPKKPLPAHPSLAFPREPTKGSPPAPPAASHIPKNSSPTPPPVPPTSKKGLQSRTVSLECPSVFIQTPATLPICEKLATRVVLNGPVHSTLNVGGTQSLGPSSHRSKPSVPLLQPAHSRSSSQALNQTGPAPLPLKPPVLPVFKHGVHVKPAIPKFPPPLPPTKPATSFQASPDGRSFRSTAEENLPETRKKRVSSKHGTGDESDDDYENVQLPDTVFIDSTETSYVEKLFRESAASPQNGLYGIRNSGTKTAKVLVVWDAGINKARNYRLFEEVTQTSAPSAGSVHAGCVRVHVSCSLIPERQHLPGKQPGLPQPVGSDRTLLPPSSSSPRLAVSAAALHKGPEQLSTRLQQNQRETAGTFTGKWNKLTFWSEILIFKAK
ncbi:transcript variant X2 [Nothobranchius furzeri]|uniref:Transcript variant X2 n=1 Tax=Nothobranchius furzeri TaxID=105023 RepID=A0A9D3BQU0_NOTFU|nr:transcript variant X2 [Nothobranchius furzeri]